MGRNEQQSQHLINSWGLIGQEVPAIDEGFAQPGGSLLPGQKIQSSRPVFMTIALLRH
jgi:hypothetical protein